MILRHSSSEDSASLPLAVDAMGGDKGLSVQVEGALKAKREYDIDSILVGPEQELLDALKGLGAESGEIGTEDATEVITMEDSPARAVRRKPDSSLCVAYKLVREGNASAVLSSGNSGAMMAAGSMLCGLLPGIERPAIATLIPARGKDEPNIVLDVGANVDCHAHNLLQFALMGSVYHQSLFKSEKPKVALLSNGSEAGKGTDKIRNAAAVLSKQKLCNYVGYAEGRDVTGDFADVIVCDGFVGNVLLKALEGCATLIASSLIQEAKKGFWSRIGLLMAKGSVRKLFREKFDYTAYGGAPLLGLSELAVVLHGSSDARSVESAIRFARLYNESNMIDRIQNALTRLDDDLPEMNPGRLSEVLPHSREMSEDARAAAVDENEKEPDSSSGNEMAGNEKK